jgi:predicted DNA-binding WGR domain protein
VATRTGRRTTAPRQAARVRRARALPPRETPAVAGFQQFARFERIDQAQNCARFYALHWQPTLWGEVALIRQWGRIGAAGSQLLEGTYPDRESAQPLAEKLIRKRIQRRYALIDWV